MVKPIFLQSGARDSQNYKMLAVSQKGVLFLACVEKFRVLAKSCTFTCDEYRLGNKEVMPMQDSSKRMGLQVEVGRLRAGAVR
jgi:hypothetical protein